MISVWRNDLLNENFYYIFLFRLAFLSRQKKSTKIIKDTRMFPVIVKIEDPIPVVSTGLIVLD